MFWQKAKTNFNVRDRDFCPQVRKQHISYKQIKNEFFFSFYFNMNPCKCFSDKNSHGVQKHLLGVQEQGLTGNTILWS